ncbi:ABC transporter [Actibacterium mucosum KCTC 23349]|uniref:ABC transporter n=1 Tax=Actibacterium mucosum KCTC 23349 TaxID=1454373 RepID=A0A037ZE43_9RHOB|nr:ABC transporter ATP-binding protein [Actibacterium mucosum]KAJ54382.1 ABC transporter [Actibacterium mucosum KCTC 23349]
MTTTMLSAQGLCSYYGLSQVLFDMSLSVERGETLALLGRNGAGKSTTMKSLMGVLKPARGATQYGGKTISGWRPERVARAGVGYVPEDRQVFAELTVEDNLLMGAKAGTKGQRDWTLERIYDTFPMLTPLKSRQAGLLSGGEQQMLSLARTLMGNPDLLLLDEPSEGLAPLIVEQIGHVLKDLRAGGLTIVLAEQNMRFCLDLATNAVVIDHGTAVFSGAIDALMADQALIDKYLSV